MAGKRRANTGKARRTRMPTAAKLRVNTEKERLTRTPMAAPLQLNTGKARRIPTFTAAPLLPRTVKARTPPRDDSLRFRCYHPPTAYYGYHPPATVNYYGSTCANCNGWAAAAAVTTAAVTGAAVASANANAANANAAAASANAYNAGYNAGTTTSQPATTTTTVVATAGNYSMGQMVGALPAGCITPTVQGTTYYLCGNTWFSAAYGANGVYYRVVPGPGG